MSLVVSLRDSICYGHFERQHICSSALDAILAPHEENEPDRENPYDRKT